MSHILSLFTYLLTTSISGRVPGYPSYYPTPSDGYPGNKVHNFIDDTTLTELITPSYSPSNMSDYLNSLLIWTTDNDMQLNTFKTKEMILGRTDSTSIPSLSTPAGPIQCVTTFKLLGLHLDASLSWTTQINTVVSKASKRLYFLKQLKRAGVPPNQLLYFYTTVIRPVLEYASPVWHYSITRAQSYQLESIQKRAVHIIFSDTRGMSYHNIPTSYLLRT